MNKEINYPIKYALLAIKDDFDTPVCFIVSKCFLVEAMVKYYASGEEEKFYKVIFPYNNFKKFKNDLKNNQNPFNEKNWSLNVQNLKFNPVNIVAKVFSCYEEALLETKNENNKLKSKIWRRVSYDISDPNFALALKKEIFQFEENLYLGKLYENAIFNATLNMRITQDNKGLIR